MTMPSDLINDLAVAVAERFRPTCDDTLQQALEVSNFVERAKALIVGQTLRGVIMCTGCGNPYAVEARPRDRYYRVVETRCTCPPKDRQFHVVDCGDSDWGRIDVCNDGVGHEYAMVGDGWQCVHCGGQAVEIV